MATIHPAGVKILTLTDEQIKARSGIVVPSTEVLDYVGFPQKLFYPLNCIVVVDTTAGAYTNINPGLMFLYWGDGDSSLTKTGIAITAAAHKKLYNLPVDEFTTEDDDLFDNSLRFVISNSGDLEDGHPDNTIKVIVYYAIIDV